MKYSDYAAFVRTSDRSVGRPAGERKSIAVYGIAAEIGSLLSEIKKAMLMAAEEGEASVAGSRRQQVGEEIGDVLWYVISLAQCSDTAGVNAFTDDIRYLHREISGDDQRAATIATVLTAERKATFLDGAVDFLARDDFELDDYQHLAFMTRRTEGGQLERVCLAVLMQLGAEVLRKTLPPIELDLNRKLADRNLDVVLGELVWHLSAVATLSGLSMSCIAEANEAKLTRRFVRGGPTPLHDGIYPPHERFPRKLDVCFVSVGKGRSQMYFAGRPLGDALTDNFSEPDGYRFHDVMHLALLAKLGWSPVLRKLISRKRKSDPGTDEVQDGARAQIVEELIIKSIHSEGLDRVGAGITELAGSVFERSGLLPFRFLSQISRLAAGLEAGQNQLWEWEDAILEGSRLFQALRVHDQGTVSIDLDARTISFHEDVHLDLPGSVAGVGCAAVELDSRVDPVCAAHDAVGQTALKKAVLGSLALNGGDIELLRQTEVRPVHGGGLVVKAGGPVQQAVWARRAISFKFTWIQLGTTWICTVFALSDPRSGTIN